MSLSRRQFLKASAALTASATARANPDNDRPPNIVIAVLDDVGFGDLGCYGSEIPTACIDSLAANGIRYNNFHVTSLCAPTRASLLTGRNSHAAGVGNIAEWGRSHPGYRGWIRDDVDTLAELLGSSGYRNYAVGKWHLSTVEGRNATGPFDQWPTGRGFDHWYGFHGAAADHWHPELFRNRHAVYPDKSAGYHLTEDMLDQSIAFLTDHQVAASRSPFFLYLAFGACHYPYHVPANYMQRHRSRYSAGWDVLRRQRFEQQKEMGIVPRPAKLAPRNDGVPAWSGLSADEQRFSARTQEAYAGFLHHTDDQLSRLVDALEQTGQIDNTILIVLSDNGAGSWAPPAGRLDVHRVVYIEPETIDELIANIDSVGTAESHPSYSPGWAQVSNTPLKYYKGDTFEGGIRAPLVVHWPAGKLPANTILSQYHHVTDIVPTLLELAGQKPDGLDGKSMTYLFDSPEAPSARRLQHYETAGDRAIWMDGWKAVAMHKPDTAYEDDVWALYHAAEDFTETENLAADYPERLERMKATWREEAERNNVLPLEDDLMALEQNVGAGPEALYVFYPGTTRLARRSAPDIFHYDFEMRASVELSDDCASGVLLASGDSMAGYEWLMRNGVVEFTYIYTRSKHYQLRSAERVGPGSHDIVVRGRKTGERSGRFELYIDSVPSGAIDISAMWEVKSLNAGVRCGENRGAPVSRSYEGSNPFDQALKQLTVRLEI